VDKNSGKQPANQRNSMKRINSLNHLRQAHRAALLIAALLSFPSFATVVASVNKNNVAQNEVFLLRISSDQKVSVDDLDLSALNRDFIVGRPSFSNSVSIINGQHSASSEWSVSMATTHTGIVTIPSLTIANEQTQEIAIQVVNDKSAPAPASLVDMQTQLDRNELYPNESGLLSVRLVIKADTRRLQNPQITPPSAQGVTLEPASEPDQHQEVVDGLDATVLQQTFRITATKSGTFSVTEPKFSSTLLYNSGRGDTRIMSLETTPKTYTINVLPKPAHYQGDWLPTSQLTLSQSWIDGDGHAINSGSDNLLMKVGDSITRITILTVKGMTQEHLPHIAIQYPDSIRLYEEKPKFSADQQGDTVMEIKQVLIPSQAGTFTLPNIEMNWWDTNTKQTQLASVPGLTLTVGKGAAVNREFSLPDVPKAAPEIKTITQIDSGFWPYLTALFALLWVISTILLLTKRTSNTNTQTNANISAANNATDPANIDVLLAACQARDGIDISRFVQQWLNQANLSITQKDQVMQELDNLLRSLYSKQAHTIDSGPLIKLIRSLTKLSRKGKKEPKETLAKL
jgi:hypothetical protein